MSNVAVIHVRVIFISAFLFYCLLLNHSFPTNPNRITNCFKLILFYITTLPTTLLLRRYFDLTSNIGSQFAASLLDQLLASQPKNPETLEQDKAEREQIITRATTAATKAGYAEGIKDGVEDEATAIRLGKIAGKYLKQRRAVHRVYGKHL